MSTKDDAARYVFGVANKEIAELEARIKKMAELASCAYTYIYKPQEIETWLDEIIRVANEAARQSAQQTCANCGNTEDNHVGRGHHFVPDLSHR